MRRSTGWSSIRAWFAGVFHPCERLAELQQWNRIFSLKYGPGIERFGLPRVFSLLSVPPELLGHASSTGTVLFHDPVRDAWIAGVVNLACKPQLALRTMLRLLRG